MSTILLSANRVCVCVYANRENWQIYRCVIIIESVLRARFLALLAHAEKSILPSGQNCKQRQMKFSTQE